MSKKARSARGQFVDFDVLAIKQQLSTSPVPVGVDDRRRFIDEKDGIRIKQAQPQPEMASALFIAQEGIAESEAAAFDEEDHQEAE